MPVSLKAIGSMSDFYSASVHATSAYRTFVEAVERMRAAAAAVDESAKGEFGDLDKALELLKPIFS